MVVGIPVSAEGKNIYFDRKYDYPSVKIVNEAGLHARPGGNVR